MRLMSALLKFSALFCVLMVAAFFLDGLDEISRATLAIIAVIIYTAYWLDEESGKRHSEIIDILEKGKPSQ